jgi:NAD(P)H-dependent flavin oxidoreductase YrpB (nitropropane dioxygenase family)
MGVKVSTAELAAAVANCGAAGTIAGVGLGFGNPLNDEDYYRASREALREEVKKARTLTKGVIGINILVALKNYEDLCRTAAQEKIDYIASGAGLPLKLPELAEGSPTKLLPIVSSAKAASLLIRSWKKRYDRVPDGLIVEGPRAGGHLGYSKEELHQETNGRLETIVSEVVKVTEDFKAESGINIPVIAAGGVYYGRDIAKFLRLGAQGVQMATRFVVTTECTVDQKFKDAFIKAKDEDIVIIDSPVGMPGRAIRNAFIDKVTGGQRVQFKCNYRCLRTCNPGTAPYCIARALFNAAGGDIENALIFAGSNVSLVDRVMPVKELIDELFTEARAELAAHPA